MDEAIFRWHQVQVWFDTEWWGNQYLTAYPLLCGFVAGVIIGYYAEPFADWCERIHGRRAMRKRLTRKK